MQGHNSNTLSCILFACNCKKDLQSASARKRKLRRSSPRLTECIMRYFDTRMPYPLGSLPHCATGQKQVLRTWRRKTNKSCKRGKVGKRTSSLDPSALFISHIVRHYSNLKPETTKITAFSQYSAANLNPYSSQTGPNLNWTRGFLL